MAYTWGYIIDASLAKLDLNQIEAGQQHLTSRFYIYANEVITQVCSAIKPKRTFVKFEITSDMVGEEQSMPEDFVSFGDDVCYQLVTLPPCKFPFELEPIIERRELHDDDFTYQGYDKLVFFHTGEFYISYNARWYTFTSTLDPKAIINIPTDILDCIPSYIAAQCFKIDDEYKASVFRNEYEMFLARIDDTDYANSKTMIIGGDW